MDGAGSGVTNRIPIGSHTASDVRKVASRMHCAHTLCELGYARQRPPYVEIAREFPVTERRPKPVPVSRDPPDDPRSDGANVR